MLKIKNLLSILLIITSITSTNVFANTNSKLTENEVMEQIKNNTATVSYSARPLNSFTQDEINQRPELKYIFDKLNEHELYTINKEDVSGKLYTTTIITEGGQKVIYASYPKITFSVVDVGTAGSSDIYSTFEVIETVNVDGNLDSGWSNAIRYRNITGAMGCGYNTAFTDDVSLSGNTSGLWGTNIKGIIELVIDKIGFSTVNEILGVLENITYSGGSESNRNINDKNVRAVGAEIDDKELFSNEHDLTIQSSISTIDSSKEINKSTKAAAEWEYDVYYFLGSLSPKYSDETICCDVDYLVNVK